MSEVRSKTEAQECHNLKERIAEVECLKSFMGTMWVNVIYFSVRHMTKMFSRQ